MARSDQSTQTTPPAAAVENTPANVAAQYLNLDAAGAYLTPEGRERISSLTDGPPESNQVVFVTHIVSSFRVLSPRTTGNTSVVQVEYDYVGVVTDDFFTFKPNRRASRGSLVLKKGEGGKWRVAEYPAPHMSVDVVCRHLEKIAREAKDPKYFTTLAAEVRKTSLKGVGK